MIKTDVIIVGGGPAGSACAWKLRQHNVDCIIIDQSQFPRFKPCAGWITPDVVKDLKMNIEEYPYGFTTFTSLQVVIRKFKFRLPTRQHSIRRIEFDHWLLQRSCAPVHQHMVKSIRQVNGSYEIDGKFSAKFLVGAGGTYCPVYRTLFKTDNPKARESLIAAQEEEFPYEGASKDCWLWFWENLPGYAWYVPKANGYINVGIGAWAEALKANGDRLQTHWDLLVKKLEETGLVRNHTFQPSAHTYYLRQRLPEIRKGNAFIIGDAAGLATQDMGEGIGPAIRSGMLAADAIATGSEYTLDSIPKYSQGMLLGKLVQKIYDANKRA